MPELRTRDEFAVIGIAARTSNSAEMSGAEAKIPGLWNDYYASGVADRIPNRVEDQSTLAVYTDYETDHNGPYSLVLGQQVSSLEEVPDGMVGLEIPAGRYLGFPAEGPVPESIIAAWRDIWSYFQDSREFARAYTNDFEIYKNNTTEIFIAIV